MDLNYLANFGVLGLWTGYLIYEKRNQLMEFTKNIQANTLATQELSNKTFLNTNRLDELIARIKKKK